MATRRKPSNHPARQRGVTLIELMIALLLGLIVVASAGAMFLSNKRTYGTSETLNRIQENERAAFEIMSRDLRETGGNPCSSTARTVNMLNQGGSPWWEQYEDGLIGYGAADATPGTPFGTGNAQRVAGTEAIDLALATDGDVRVTAHTTPSANIQVTDTDDFADGQILMICNMDFKMIFQVTQLNSAGGGVSIQHNGGGGTTGNCSQVFQIFDDVASCNPGASGAGYCFTPSSNPNCDESGNSPARVALATVARWYIGRNDRGGTSLYRARLMNSGATATPQIVGAPVEIAEGATDMEFEYMVAGATDFVAAAAVADWSQVTAVRVSVVFEGVEGALEGRYIEGTDGEALTHALTNVVALRNREDLL